MRSTRFFVIPFDLHLLQSRFHFCIICFNNFLCFITDDIRLLLVLGPMTFSWAIFADTIFHCYKLCFIIIIRKSTFIMACMIAVQTCCGVKTWRGVSLLDVCHCDFESEVRIVFILLQGFFLLNYSIHFPYTLVNQRLQTGN